MKKPRPGPVNPNTGKPLYKFDPNEARKAAQEAERDRLAGIRALERHAAALKSADRFMPFVKFTMPDPEAPDDVNRSRYKNARHHDAIARVLEEVEKGEIQFLILTMPPRHGKTQLVSRHLPAWFIGRHPDQNVVVAAYGDELAMDIGAEVRAIMGTTQYRYAFPGVQLRRGGAAKDRIQTTKGGLMVFVGRGSSLTGRGAHLLIIDDLIKDDKEAQSQTIRDQAWSWFTKVAMTRRMGKKLVVMTFTRWHADDPIGRLTNDNAEENPYFNPALAKKIRVINFPAYAEEDDPLGRPVGAPLWPDGPDQFDETFLEEQRAIDPLGFSALYQQRPSVADGVLFRRENIRRYHPVDLPKNLRYYAASDHALGLKQRNDPSCFGLAGVDEDGNLYLTQVDWRKMPTDAAVESMLVMAGGTNRPLLWWAERGHISQSIGPFLRKRMQETGTYINIREVTPVGDKAQRAQSIAARIAQGKVFLPIGPRWADAAIEQLMAFPNAAHDDFVDMMSLFGLGLQSQFRASAPAKKPEEPAFGTLGWVKLMDKYKNEQRRAANAGGF
ncbi:hypothetical protein ASF22_02655 [Methylobacterium sp. Leaf87]|uniref:phage terminase large subunit n=1 Tax=Methylobacterium sp. Leaf87 TaxID=1736243 RepID=UPI0006FAD17C|nr:phage terminase large subunit [Methylobacterium sp. Leaf87]KQO69527.1 hypothetical protein ASF22_02655 [Methylobacterium sp. Leaf87]